MILPFVVDPAALRQWRGASREERALHEVLLRAWDELGLLVLERADVGRSEVLRAVRTLHVSVRKRWETLLTARRCFRVARRHWTGFESGGVPGLAALENDALLALLADATADGASVPAEATRRDPASRLELARFPCFSASRSLEEIRQLRMAEIPAGTGIREVWDRWFRPHAELARSAVIVDRFAGRQLVTRNPQHAPRRNSGLARFLEFLHDVPSIREVSLLVAEGAERDGVEREHILAALRELLAGTRWARKNTFTAWVIDDDHFQATYHDRYVRFDSVRIALGPGLELFSRDTVGRAAAYAVGPRGRPARRAARCVEDALCRGTDPWTFGAAP